MQSKNLPWESVVEGARAGIGDCSLFPFSRSEAKTLEETSKSVDLVKVSHRSGILRLRSLGGGPILQWPPVLPPHDPKGMSSAGEFRCWKKACASKLGIAGAYRSRKAGGRTWCHSHLEETLLRYFEMCPYVIEIRTQYPALDFDKFERCLLTGKRFARKDIMTIDFMLTLRFPGYPYRIYHAVSGKPEALLLEPEVTSRHERESSRVSEWSTHEVMTELTISPVEHVNHRRLLSYMMHTERIEDYALAAAELARALHSTSARGTLDRVLTMVAKRHGWNQRTGYKIFGIAHFLGYLKWNHFHEVSRDKSMMLLK